MVCKHIVIKLGSSIVLNSKGHVEKKRITKLLRQITSIQSHGFSVTLVVSGAVAVGKRCTSNIFDSDASSKQMLAGIGQIALMAELQSLFFSHNLHAAQLLLTQEDLTNSKKRESINKMICTAAKSNTIIIVNENDSVELNNFGGNDYLACKIAKLISADYLLLLTDVEGVYAIDKTILKEIASENLHKIASIKKFKKVGGVGSMEAKVKAANQAAKQNIQTYITSGHTENLLFRLIIDKEHIGTKVLA